MTRDECRSAEAMSVAVRLFGPVGVNGCEPGGGNPRRPGPCASPLPPRHISPLRMDPQRVGSSPGQQPSQQVHLATSWRSSPAESSQSAAVPPPWPIDSATASVPANVPGADMGDEEHRGAW